MLESLVLYILLLSNHSETNDDMCHCAVSASGGRRSSHTESALNEVKVTK